MDSGLLKMECCEKPLGWLLKMGTAQWTPWYLGSHGLGTGFRGFTQIRRGNWEFKIKKSPSEFLPGGELK